MVAASADTTGQGLFGRASDLLPIALGLSALVVAFSLMYLPSIQWILGEWSGSSGVLSHGYLIAAISVYLFVRAIPEVANLPIEPMWSALPALLVLSLTWLLGHAASVVAVQAMVLPAIVLTAIAAAYGMSITRRFAFPVLFIYFAIPAVEHLQFIFQQITIVVVHELIRMVDIAAYVEGKFVYIPEGTFAIESGCSGLSFVVSGLSLAALYGYLYHDHWWKVARLALVVLIISMLGNWIRVFSIVNIGYFYGMDNKLIADHLWLGWVIFSILMLPVFLFARWLEADGLPDKVRSSRGLSAAGHIKVVPIIPIGAAILTLMSGPAWAKFTAVDPAFKERVRLVLPENVEGWQGPHATAWDWRPRYVGATTESLAEYKQEEMTVLVYANVYLSQAQGRELIYYKNRITGGWRKAVGDAGPSSIEIANAGRFQLSFADTPYGRWVILHRNIIDGAPVIGDVSGKLFQAIASLRGHPEAGVVAFATPCAKSCLDATDALGRFVSVVGHDATVNFVIGES